MKDMTLKEGEFRVIVPGGSVDINVSLNDADGNPVVTVDVVADAPRFGPDKDGRSWAPVNGEPGVVRLVGRKPQEVRFERDGEAITRGQPGEDWVAIYTVPAGADTRSMLEDQAEEYDQNPRFERLVTDTQR